MGKLPVARILLSGLTCVVLWLGLSAATVAQDPKGQSLGIRRPGDEPPTLGIRRPEGKTEPGVVTPVTPIKPGPPKVTPVSSLTLYTESQATVVLRRLKSGGPLGQERKADIEGIASFSGLRPGTYQLEVSLEGYKSIFKTLEIKSGQPMGLSAPLESRFGTYWILMGKQVGADVLVKLNGIEEKPEEVLLEPGIEETRAFRLVKPVGVYRLEIRKPGYIGRSWDQLEIISDSTSSFTFKKNKALKNQLVVNLELATIALGVKSQPGARVYIDGQSKGEIDGKGNLLETVLLAGEHKLRVELFGYESVERALNLTLENPRVIEDVSLVSLVETSPGVSEFDAKKNEWYPVIPAEWTLTDGVGVTVRGDRLALLKKPGMPNRNFMIFGDFTLIFYLRFEKSGGASWVVRARDEKNYYLFELTALNSRGERRLVFYRCDDGKLKEIDDCAVMVDLDPKGQFIIRLVGSGGKFWHCIQVNNATTGPKDRALGKTFTDYTFDKGGVGLRAVNGSEFYVFEQFSAQLGAIVNEQCAFKP